MVNKRIRNIELDLLNNFQTIAKDLHWWFENQTLIEIIQHGTITLEHGYIEIGMLRDNYLEFIHRCGSLRHPYVLKSFENRKFSRGYAKLVNVRTTAIVAKEGIFDVEDIEQGMFLIVYPFDKISIHEDFQTACKTIARLRADAVNNFIHWKNGFVVEEEWLAHGRRYNDYLSKNNPSDSKIIANLTLASSRGYTDIRYLDDVENLEGITLEDAKGYVPHDSKDIVSRLRYNQSLNENITLIDSHKAYTKHLFKPITMTDEEFLSNLKMPVGNDFLKEEIRCGYTVTSKMKRQWALCLDLLSELDRVCQCNNIKWYADGGTLLGAARHKGFIPWDDDIDVMLLREDYDKLLSCADLFEGRYFLQTFTTDYVCKSKARLINTASSVLTTFQSIQPKRHQEKQGCFIDIFPLDHIKSDDQWADLCRRRIGYLRAASMYKSRWLAFGDEAAKEKMQQSYAVFDAITKEGKASGKTKYGANLGFLQASRFLKREMEDYDDIVYLPFENMKLPCPVGYKRCLDYIYGKDWHVFKKGLACHNIWKYDTDTPWEAYCDYYKRCQTDNKAKIAIETSQNCSTKT